MSSLHSRGFPALAAVPSAGRPSFAGGPARAPQAAATEGLYERHAAKILSYCQHQLGSREEAEDAVQTTFMNAFRALGRGVVPEAESAWLYKIAENVCLSRRRSSWRRGRIESPSDFEVIEEIVPGPSRQRDELIGIEDALASMPEQQRRAILLREWQGLSYREISDELELSQSAVETLIFRARRSLAQGLEQPDLLKKPKRKSFRRALHVIDLGTIAAAVKTLLAGSVAVKATAAAVAVTAAATAVSVTPKLEGHSPKPAAAPVAVGKDVAPQAVAAAAPTPSVVSLREDAAVQPAAATRAPAPAPAAAVKQPARTPRAAPSRSVPVAAAPVAPAQLPAVTPAVEQPAPAPPAEAAPAPVAEQPAPAHVPAAQAAPVEEKPAETKNTDEGTPKQPTTGRSGGHVVAPVSPTVPVAPAVVEESSDEKAAPEKERRSGKNRRDRAVAAVTDLIKSLLGDAPVAEPAEPVAEPATEPPVTATPPAVTTPPAAAAPPAATAPPVPAPPATEPATGSSGQDKGRGHRRRK